MKFRSSIIAALLVPIVCILANVQAKSQPVSGHWCTVLLGYSTACFPSANEACSAQWGSFNGPHFHPKSRFIGTVRNNTNWTKVGCQWTTFQYLCPQENATGGIVGINECGTTLPVSVDFYCPSGYTRVFPGRCTIEREVEKPVTTCSDQAGIASSPTIKSPSIMPAIGNPAYLKTGSKLEYAVDFQTMDGRFKIARHYRSFEGGGTAFYDDELVGIQPILGLTQGWRFNFGMELHIFEDYSTAPVVGLHTPDGSGFQFERQANGSFATKSMPDWSLPSNEYKLEFVGTPPTGSIFDASTQWRVTDSDNSVWLLQTRSDINRTTPRYHIARPVQVKYQDGYALNFTYASDGSLQTITDSFGRTATFTWHPFYITAVTGVANAAPYPMVVKSIVLPDGTSVNYSYDPAPSLTAPSTSQPRRLTKVERKNSAGVVVDSTQYHYEHVGFEAHITGITDGRGVRYANFAYDDLGRAIKTEHVGPNGSVEKYEIAYSSVGVFPTDFLRTVTNPLGKQTVYRFRGDYSGRRKLVAVEGQASTNCVAAVGSYTYDASNFLQNFTDEEGRVTSYTRDAVGRATQIVEGFGTPAAKTTGITWHATLNAPATVVEPGLTTAFTYNSAGQLTQLKQTDTTSQTVPYSTNGQIRTWDYTYGAAGTLLTVDGPLAGAGDKVTYTYNAQGYLATITNPVGHVTTVNAVNGRGQPTQVTDANGTVTNYSYDNIGRLISITVEPGAAQAQWSMTYTGAGDIATLSQPNGTSYTFTWDSARRLTAIQNSWSERIEYTYNAMNNVTDFSVRNSGGGIVRQSTQTFDELGRLIRQAGYWNRTWTFGYDKTGNLTRVTDPRAKSVLYGFDAVSRLVTETERDAGVVTLGYNGKSEVTNYKDSRNLNTAYIRNGFGEVIREVSPDRGTTTYVRDARGLVTQMTDARAIVANFTYDNANRILTRSYPAATAENVTYTYDSVTNGNKGKGRLTSITDQAGSSAFVYNAKGQLTAETRTTATKVHTVGYAWTPGGLLTSITYPSGRIVTYAYDGQARVNGITMKATAAAAVETVLSSVEYPAFSTQGSFGHGNGLYTLRTFYTDGTPDGIDVRPNGGTPLMRRWHWFDTDFTNLTILNDNDVTPTETQTFTYDDAGRLKTASSGAYGARSYNYDLNGNRLSEIVTPPGGSAVTRTYAYPAASNRLTNVTQASTTLRAFTYDAAGNVTVDSRSGTAWTMTINKAGRLSAVTQGGYTYDGRQRLAIRVVSNTTGANGTTHLIHGFIGCAGPANDNFSAGGALACDRVLAETNGTGPAGTTREYIWLGDLPVAVIDKSVTPNKTYWVHADHLNRPYFMTDATRAVVWKAIYEPFGTVYSTTGTAAQTLRFPGQWFQIESNLAYNWHRHYDATTGRYFSADPLNHALNGAPVTASTQRGGSIAPHAANLNWLTQGWLPDTKGSAALNAVNAQQSVRAAGLFPDGPNIYNYARQDPGKNTDPTGLGTALTGPANTAVWVSTKTLRLYGPDGKAACDFDINGAHGTLEMHIWNGEKRGKPVILVPLKN